MLVAVLIAGSAFAQPVGGDSGSNPAPTESRQEPADSQPPVRSPSIQGLLDRIAGALEAASNKPASEEEREHDRRDLEAQEGMARWAKWMFGATALSVVLTGGGIWLVVLNLREARRVTREAIRSADTAQEAVVEARKATVAANRAADETKRIGDAQTRAYVHAADATLLVPRTDCRVVLSLKNTGQSPAVYFRVCSTCSIADHPVDKNIPAIPRDLKYNTWTGLGGNDSTTVAVYPENLAIKINRANNSTGVLLIYGRIVYADIFDCEWETEFAFFIGKPINPGDHKMSRPNAQLKAYQPAEGQA